MIQLLCHFRTGTRCYCTGLSQQRMDCIDSHNMYHCYDCGLHYTQTFQCIFPNHGRQSLSELKIMQRGFYKNTYVYIKSGHLGWVHRHILYDLIVMWPMIYTVISPTGIRSLQCYCTGMIFTKDGTVIICTYGQSVHVNFQWCVHQQPYIM